MVWLVLMTDCNSNLYTLLLFMNDITTKNTKPNTRKFVNRFVSSLLITTSIWVYFLVPKQDSRAEQIIDNLQWNLSWFEITQSINWNWVITINQPNELINVKDEPKTTGIVVNNNWNWEDEETNQGWSEFVLNWGNDFAKEVAAYLWSKNPDPIMIATFIAESWLNPRSKSTTADNWLCQLNYTYNKKIIDDPRFFSDWKWQADYCVSKWSVANHNIWVAYKSWAYKKYLYLFK